MFIVALKKRIDLKLFFSYLLAGLFLACHNNTFAQLKANAGIDKTICPGATYTLGGSPTATGGTAPYKYKWVPVTGLSSDTVANPVVTVTGSFFYKVYVTDNTASTAVDSVFVIVDPIDGINAGLDTGICENGSIKLGGQWNVTWSGTTYNWQPATLVDNPISPNPIASPTVTTTFTLTAASPGCPLKRDEVIVTVFPPPVIEAGPDLTILEGETVSLQVTGATNYYWTPSNTLNYFNTATPDASPLDTTTYYVFGSDNPGCWANDSVRVIVKPSDEPIFYNTFTPNNDNDNDYWFIGNIQKYPDNHLTIYGRYGKVVFDMHSYDNSWNGTGVGEPTPAGTYYYIFETGGTVNKKYYGSVSIIR